MAELLEKKFSQIKYLDLGDQKMQSYPRCRDHSEDSKFGVSVNLDSYRSFNQVLGAVINRLSVTFLVSHSCKIRRHRATKG